MEHFKVIAIDGPAAAGKSTIAKQVAEKLGYVYIDTGAMYRAVALKGLSLGVDLDDENQISKMLEETAILLTDSNKVFLDGEEVTEAIRSQEVSLNTSKIATYKFVRDELKRRQIKYADKFNVVMDGRDIGTNVFPDAEYKIFMTASVEVRAERRYQENLARNIPSDLESLKREIKERDEIDSRREHAPLVKAEDAILIDTSLMTIDEVVNKIITIVRRDWTMNEVKHKEEETMSEVFNFEDFLVPTINDIVEGVVVRVEPQEVTVDIKGATEGTIYIQELALEKIESAKDIVKVGDTIKAVVKKVDDEQILLSRRALLERERFQELKQAFEKGEILEGKVVRAVKNALIVNIGIDAFLPINMIDVNFVSDISVYVGQTIPVRIVEFNPRNKRIRVSRKAVIAEQLKAAREEQLQTLAVDDVYDGVVVRIEEFGAFVRFGALEGLVHISEIAHLPIGKVADALEVGQEVKVKVLKITDGKTKLSIKATIPTPFEAFVANHQEGDIISGVVTSLTNYGAFVKVAEGVEGLVHMSELSWERHVKLDEVMSQGKTINVKIISINQDEARIGLSLKQLEPDPWSIFAHKTGDIVKGEVISLTEIGAFIRVAPHIEGLCHFSEASWDPNQRLADLITEGSEVEVKIISLDTASRRVGLSLRQVKANPWVEAEIKTGAIVTGVVDSTNEKGALIKIAEGVVGFLPINQIAEKRIGRVEEVLTLGQEVEVKVTRFEPKQFKLELSIRRIKEDAEREEYDQYMKQQKQEEAETETLGDLFGDTLKELL